MDYPLDHPRRLRAEDARVFARQELAPHADDWDRDGHFPIKTLARAAERGYLGLLASPERDGQGLPMLDSLLVLEALAGGCAASAIFIGLHNLALWTLENFAEPALKAHWSPRLARSELLASYCFSPTVPVPAQGETGLSARRDGEGYRLDGCLERVCGAGACDVLIVQARLAGNDDGASSSFLLPAGLDGLGYGAEAAKTGWRALPIRSVRLENLYLPADHRLGAEGQGARQAQAVIQRAHLLEAGVGLGTAHGALALTLRHLRERRQPGRPLAGLEPTHSPVSDLYAGLCASRQLVHLAARRLDEHQPQAALACALAARFAGARSRALCEEAVGLHQRYGYLADHSLERHVRDSAMALGIDTDAAALETEIAGLFQAQEEPLE
ncbi:acyl-CoA dehydrogenase family protein [Pseudomonas sp. RIT-PI-AD]|uniref:acyl-CoA dehydrogenase family protein n=1 Tax=Pseudomonas sp. RIT-PI-AD TaxID=3035294 RepID=UPI0021D8362D|nr:acyl-CoA dehydrogenase family protein [Pseudomonas sp. RIT-PI-AD]